MIEKAPLFFDPVYDGPTDPTVRDGARSANRARRRASAMGDRQMLPVQANRTSMCGV